MIRKYYFQAEEAAGNVLKVDKRNLIALYILLSLSCEARKMSNSESSPNITPSSPPEDYAVKIKNLNHYLGYLAWGEVYESLGQSEKHENLLVDLTEAYPKHPHAFLKLWDLRFRAKNYIDSIDPIEELFVKMGDFYMIPEVRIALVPLLYAKSLFKTEQYVFCFELLQNEYCKRPLYTVFLYFFGKFAVTSAQKSFRGTAIGILQECLRSCVSQRRAKIEYYLAIAYKEMGQPLLAFDHFQKSLEYFRNKDYVFNG